MAPVCCYRGARWARDDKTYPSYNRACKEAWDSDNRGGDKQLQGGLVEETGQKVISELAGVPVMGIIPYDRRISARDVRSIVSLVERNADVEAIANFIGSS